MMNLPEHVPYGSAYGLENLVAQKSLLASSIVVLDEAFVDFGNHWHEYEVERLAEQHASEEARRVFFRQMRSGPFPTMSTVLLPEVYEANYKTFDFLKNWVVALALVGWKLAQPAPCPLTNVAEELALHVLIEEAISRLDEIGPENPEAEEQLRGLYDSAFEDDDFMILYELEDFDPCHQMGLTDLRFKNWFQPFGSGVDRGVPHPFLLDS